MSLLIVISCKKDKDSYTVTGTILDQVTKLPVADATVYRAIRPSSDAHSTLRGLTSTLSGRDGRFSIEFLDTDYELPFSFPYVYVTKSGFAGSSYMQAKVAGDVGVLVLYHTAVLRLRVRNDTISYLPTYLQRDDVYLSLEGGLAPHDHPDFIGKTGWDFSPQIVRYCKGRKLDTVIVFSPVWANVDYYVKFFSYKPVNFPRSYFTSQPIIIKPDSVAHLTVWF